MSCGRFNVGDRGQRYEVRYYHGLQAEEKVFGWTDQADGGALMESAKLAPWAHSPWVVDRMCWMCGGIAMHHDTCLAKEKHSDQQLTGGGDGSPVNTEGK